MDSKYFETRLCRLYYSNYSIKTTLQKLDYLDTFYHSN